MPGFVERFSEEISSLTHGAKTKVIAPPERKHWGWVGGSIVASMSTFQNLWVTAEEYEEVGPSVVHRKCS